MSFILCEQLTFRGTNLKRQSQTWVGFVLYFRTRLEFALTQSANISVTVTQLKDLFG